MNKHGHHNRWSLANLRFHLYRYTRLPFMTSQPFPIGTPPVVIGAMGGSGTRVLVPILQLAGYWMGNWINPKTEDTMATRHLLQIAFKQLIEQKNDVDPQLITLFSRLIQAHRHGMPNLNGPWGWKNPRSMWIIPFLASLYPDMKFIHVVRDGRDMALSKNHNLLNKHGDYLLHNPRKTHNALELQIELWCKGNRTAMHDGQTYLGKNYLLLKYECLCQQPVATLNQLFSHLAITPSKTVLERATTLLETEYIGRWQRSDHPLLQQPDKNFRDTLDEFGYE